MDTAMEVTFKVCNGEGRVEGVDKTFYPIGTTIDGHPCKLFGSSWNTEELHNQVYNTKELSKPVEIEESGGLNAVNALLSNNSLSFRGHGYRIHSQSFYEADYKINIVDINEIRLPDELKFNVIGDATQKGFIRALRKRKDSRNPSDIIEFVPLVSHWATLDAYYLYIARII